MSNQIYDVMVNRNLSPDEASKAITGFVTRDYQKQMVDAQFWRCCLNCNDTTIGGKCLKYGVVPPPEVIVHGCQDWSGLPF